MLQNLDSILKYIERTKYLLHLVTFYLTRAAMSEIVYPQGCRSVTEDLGPDELIRRLKVQLHTIAQLVTMIILYVLIYTEQVLIHVTNLLFFVMIH